MTLGYFVPRGKQFPGGVTSLPNPPWKVVPCLSLPDKCKLLSRALLPLWKHFSETLMALGPSTSGTPQHLHFSGKIAELCWNLSLLLP